MPGAALRLEEIGDETAIRELTRHAFASMAFSDGSEPGIIDGLRRDGDLTLSIVAVENGIICGHVAFSPVAIAGEHAGWYGLGPISVEPRRQRRGIGSILVRGGIERLRRLGARGCALVGDPGFYRRFGFVNDGCLSYGGLDPRYVQRLVLDPPGPCGPLTYARAFAG